MKQTFCWWMLTMFIGLLAACNTYAQTDSLTDESSIGRSSRLANVISLSAVTVRAITPERFVAGQKLQRIDSATLLQFRFGSLQDLLMLNTPLAFKSYGPGQLATVSFRGTSANHTAVLWNSININQPNLGQTDFSTLPVAGFDRLAVQYGSTASVVGSDAVGGSILLGSSPGWPTIQSGAWIRTTVGLQLASFRNNQLQAGVRYGSSLSRNWQLSGKTFVYRNQFNNVYPYTERRHTFLEQSTTAQRGLIQDLYFRHAKGQQISINAWLTDNDLVITPKDPVARERTRTQSARLLATYEADRLTLRVGWIRDLLDYGKGDFKAPDHTGTDRFISRAEREFGLIRNKGATQLNLRVGGEWSHYRTRTDGYGVQLIRENRGDLYALWRLQTARWLVSANIRQAFITRFNPPLTPSFGAEYRLVQHSRFTLTTKGSIGRSYRVPTLNERYWIGLGNPNLLPERGLNLEAGLAANIVSSDVLTLQAEATVYRNRIDNWTYWNPATNYHVENLQLVVARGGELATTLAYARNGWRAGLRVGYALTRSSQERAYDAYSRDVIGKQLPYVPIHTGTVNAFIQHGQTRLTVQSQATSRRYITFDNTQFFKGVMLTNILVENTTKLGPVPIRLQGQVNNVFDALSFSVKQNALPGRNWMLNLIINFSPNTP